MFFYDGALYQLDNAIMTPIACRSVGVCNVLLNKRSISTRKEIQIELDMIKTAHTYYDVNITCN